MSLLYPVTGWSELTVSLLAIFRQVEKGEKQECTKPLLLGARLIIAHNTVFVDLWPGLSLSPMAVLGCKGGWEMSLFGNYVPR